MTRLSDLGSLRVACKPGTASDERLEEVRRIVSPDQLRPVPLQAVAESLPLCGGNRIAAVPAAGLQMQFPQKRSEQKGAPLVLVIPGIRPEIQAFAVSPTMPEATLECINPAVTRLQRNGTVQRLRQEALERPLVTPAESVGR